MCIRHNPCKVFLVLPCGLTLIASRASVQRRNLMKRDCVIETCIVLRRIQLVPTVYSFGIVSLDGGGMSGEYPYSLKAI